jgi:GNAT superfamily N-acetyltransferase
MLSACPDDRMVRRVQELAFTATSQRVFGSYLVSSTISSRWKPFSETEAARIRAFFVHPDFARHGIGRRLLEHCEAAAAEAGFNSAELVATLPGEPFYRRFGYGEAERIANPLKGGITIEFVRMRKGIQPGQKPRMNTN